MSAIPTEPVAAPPVKAVSAAALLAGATKKGKISSHLLYPGEAGREAAEPARPNGLTQLRRRRQAGRYHDRTIPPSTRIIAPVM